MTLEGGRELCFIFYTSVISQVLCYLILPATPGGVDLIVPFSQMRLSKLQDVEVEGHT